MAEKQPKLDYEHIECLLNTVIAADSIGAGVENICAAARKELLEINQSLPAVPEVPA